MKIKNGELELLIKYLDTFVLSSTEGRMRTRLKKILFEKLQQFDIERQETVKQFSRKDTDGNPLTKLDDNGQEVGDIEDTVGFNKEYIILFNEDVVIDESFSNEQMLNSVKSTVLNDNRGYSGQEADNWDYWCQVFEQINYEGEN